MHGHSLGPESVVGAEVGEWGQSREEFKHPNILVKKNCIWPCWFWLEDSTVNSPMAAGWRDCDMDGWSHSWWLCVFQVLQMSSKERRETPMISQLISQYTAGSCGRRWSRCRVAAGQDALNGATIEGVHNRGWSQRSFSFLQKVQMLLDFLSQWCGVGVLGQISVKTSMSSRFLEWLVSLKRSAILLVYCLVLSHWCPMTS